MVGSAVFWLALVIWLILLWAFVENEHSILGFLSTVAYLLLLQFAFKVNLALWTLHNLWYLAGFFGFYFVAGGCSSFWLWYVYVIKKLEPYTEMKEEWLVSKGQTNLKIIPENLKEEWAHYLDAGYGDRKKTLQATISKG